MMTGYPNSTANFDAKDSMRPNTGNVGRSGATKTQALLKGLQH